MDLNPQAVADAQFRVVRKGYDPEQVRPLLSQASESLRSALGRATTAEGRLGAAEARASDAEARALEAEARAKAALQAASVAQEAAGEDPEQLRRAILTAQKAADAVRAEAQHEAEGIVAGARDESKKITTDARAAAARMVADAEQAARAAHAAELERTRAEVAELNSMRDQLRAHADLLSAHLNGQRDRVSESIVALQAVLDNPNAVRPLPVPEHGDPTVGLAPPPGSADAGKASTADSPGAIDEDAVAGDLASLSAEAPTNGTGDAAATPADDAGTPTEGSSGEGAGEASAAAAETSTAGSTTTGSVVAGSATLAADTNPAEADPAERFFGQGEPYSDERWKSGS